MMLKKQCHQDQMKDFLEVHDATLNFGSPEICDQMSGAIYLHANISEDKCSQCLRLAAEVIPRHSINQLLSCLTQMNWWGSEASHSLALSEIVKSVDNTCVDRLNSQHFSLSDQLRLAYQWQSLIFTPKAEPKFPKSMIESFPTNTILQCSLPLLVSWLLLVSSIKPNNLKLKKSSSMSQLASDIDQHIESGCTMMMLSETELVACYQGLQILSPESAVGVSRILKSIPAIWSNFFGTGAETMPVPRGAGMSLTQTDPHLPVTLQGTGGGRPILFPQKPRLTGTMESLAKMIAPLMAVSTLNFDHTNVDLVVLLHIMMPATEILMKRKLMEAYFIKLTKLEMKIKKKFLAFPLKALFTLFI